MANRGWSEQNEQFLRDKWGEMSTARIAKKLNRTVDAVKVKAARMGLSNALDCIDGITLNQLAKVFDVSYGWMVKKIWIDKLKIPYKTKVIARTKAYRYICLDEFWKWAEKNKHRINFSKLEENVLGKEPAWVAEKRKADKLNLTYKKASIPWSKSEESLLKTMLLKYEYSYYEISIRLNRTEGAIKKHIEDLGWLERPVKTERHIKWSDSEVDTLIAMKNSGYGNNSVGERIGRTARAVERKLGSISKDQATNKRLEEYLRREVNLWVCQKDLTTSLTPLTIMETYRKISKAPLLFKAH